VKVVTAYFSELLSAIVDGWNRFWFSPSDPATLGLIRICAGAMLLYTHLVWSLNLVDFFGPHSWVSPAAAKAYLVSPDAAKAGFDDSYSWSYLWLVDSPAALGVLHIAGLAVFALLTVGLFTRVVKFLAPIVAISYVNRVPGALFGLDQINVMLSLYLMVGPAGDAWSLDRRFAARRSGQPLPIAPSVGANLSVRLIQVHMAIIYFFAGLSKMQGLSWWEGSALWGAFANLEYQSLDMTWTAGWPILVALMTQVTAWWELTFAVLVWPRLLRPLVLAIAIPLHLGIAIFLGMITFGLVMLVGCLAFVPPEWIRALAAGRQGRGGRKRKPAAAPEPADTSTAAPRRRPAGNEAQAVSR
jgi:hypothetical protein